MIASLLISTEYAYYARRVVVSNWRTRKASLYELLFPRNLSNHYCMHSASISLVEVGAKCTQDLCGYMRGRKGFTDWFSFVSA